MSTITKQEVRGIARMLVIALVTICTAFSLVACKSKPTTLQEIVENDPSILKDLQDSFNEVLREKRKESGEIWHGEVDVVQNQMKFICYFDFNPARLEINQSALAELSGLCKEVEDEYDLKDVTMRYEYRTGDGTLVYSGTYDDKGRIE